MAQGLVMRLSEWVNERGLSNTLERQYLCQIMSQQWGRVMQLISTTMVINLYIWINKASFSPWNRASTKDGSRIVSVVTVNLSATWGIPLGCGQWSLAVVSRPMKGPAIDIFAILLMCERVDDRGCVFERWLHAFFESLSWMHSMHFIYRNWPFFHCQGRPCCVRSNEHRATFMALNPFPVPSWPYSLVLRGQHEDWQLSP